MNTNTPARMTKLVALNLTATAALLAISVPSWVTDAPAWLVLLLTLVEYPLAAYALVRIHAWGCRIVVGPTGYVCRHCAADMTVTLCTPGHTQEAVTVPAGGAA